MKIKVIVTASSFLVAALGTFPSLAQQTPRSVWDGVYTADQADRGRAQFNAHCAVCHGAELGGNEMAPPLAGSQFLGNWSSLSVGDLAERIRSTMPANDPGSLNRKTVADLLAFLFLSNRFPAGNAELPGDAQILQQIRIDATKPGAP